MYKYRSKETDDLLLCHQTLFESFKIDGYSSSATIRIITLPLTRN